MKFGSNLTEGSIFKKYIFFIVPILLSGFIQQLYNAADTMVVGKFVGDTALAAVGATASLTNLILNLFLGLAVGTNAVCSRFYGAGNKEALHKTIHTSILLATVSGAVLAIIGLFLSGTFLNIMGTPQDVISDATLYMQIYFAGAPASMIYNFGSAVLRAAGDTKRPLYILMISGLVNVLLNLFCVIVLDLGVAGVAIGTIASQLISAVMVIWLLIKSNTEFKLDLLRLRIYKKELGKIAATGIPSGLNGIMFSASNVIIQSTINSFGRLAIAGATAATNLEVFGFLILSSVEQGVVTFVGQNMGAGKFDRVKAVTKIALIIALSGATLFMLLTKFAGDTLLGFFADEASYDGVVKMGMAKLSIATASFILFAPNQVLTGVLKGMGRAVESTIINAIFVCILRVVWIFAAFPLNPVLEMVYYSYPVTWGASSAAMIIVYFVITKKIFAREKQLRTGDAI